MKIVLGVHHYPPRFTAGVEMVAERHSRWLRAHGHEVQVVCVEQIDASEPLTVQTEVQDGITVHRLGLALAGTNDHLGIRFRDDRLGAWFRAFLDQARPDVFHSHSAYLLTVSTLEAARAARIPTVASLHDYWYFCPRITLLRSSGARCDGDVTTEDCTRCIQGERRRFRLVEQGLRWVRASVPLDPLLPEPHWPVDRALLARLEQRRAALDATLRSLERIVVLAPFAQRLLAARGCHAPQVQLIPSGHDMHGWRREPRVPSTRGLRVGYLGQVAPHKGIHLLIEAFRRGIGPDLGGELRIYGDLVRLPDYTRRLRTLAGDEPRIRFLGPYQNAQVEQVLAEIDVLVVPSVWYETRPLVIMEAFAAGVPVIASDLPNLRYQVRHEVDGLLFPPDDHHVLARQLHSLAIEPEQLAALARGIAPIRTLDDEMAEIVDLYQAVTSAAGPRATAAPALAAGAAV